MWQQCNLKLAPQARITLEQAQQGRVLAVNLSAKGTKMGVHNWTHGIEEKSNRYLSPENAVKALAVKLMDYADPNRPKGQQDVVVIMVTTSDIQDFIDALEKIRVLLPEPTFKQALDYAKSSQHLQTTKMLKTPTISSPAFNNQADITPGANRQMQSILRNALSSANAARASDPMQKLTALLQLKAEKEQANRAKVERMLLTKVRVYALQVQDLLEVAAERIKLNVPTANHIFTACVMYIGEDLSAIRGMINEN